MRRRSDHWLNRARSSPKSLEEERKARELREAVIAVVITALLLVGYVMLRDYQFDLPAFIAFWTHRR